jgi:hypothetical protein
VSRQLHPIGSELVNVWCCQGALTKAAEIIVTKVVGENVDDVRLFCGVAKNGSKSEEGGEKEGSHRIRSEKQKA